MFKWLCSLQPKESDWTFSNDTYCVLGSWNVKIPLHIQDSVTWSRTNINRWFKIFQKERIIIFTMEIIYYWFLSPCKSVNPGLNSFLTFFCLQKAARQHHLNASGHSSLAFHCFLLKQKSFSMLVNVTMIHPVMLVWYLSVIIYFSSANSNKSDPLSSFVCNS